MTVSLITGLSGQDGAWLAAALLARGHEVHGTYRRTAERGFARLHALGIADDVRLVLLDLVEESSLLRAVDRVRPDVVWHLGAQSFVGDSFEQPVYTLDVNATGTARLLEAVRTVRPDARWYQASTSEMFGGTDGRPLDEEAPLRPRSPYAIAKVAAHHLVGLARDTWGLRASRGLLFNHESELRGPEFVSRHVTRGVAAIAEGRVDRLVLGNLEARRDWGYAPDYVEAVIRMTERGGDYVVATGVARTVRELVDTAFAAVGVTLDWTGSGAEAVGRDAVGGAVRVVVDPTRFRPSEVHALVGDASRARADLGWSPSTPFETMIGRMVDADRRLLREAAPDGWLARR